MKLSLFRRLKKDSNKDLPSIKFFKRMVKLNPSINLQQRKHDVSSFNSDLTSQSVRHIKLPIGASYEIRPNKMGEYGFIRILYKSNSYTIYAKGLTGTYLAL